MNEVQLDVAQAGEIIGNSFRPSLAPKDPKRPDAPRKAYLTDEVGQIVANSVFDSREWTMFDNRVSQSARIVQIGIQHLRSRGLVVPVNNIGVRQIDKRIQGEKRPANITMNTSSRVDMDRAERQTLSVPLPVVHQDYQIDERELAASRLSGMPLDTLEAEESAQAVGETLESILFNGTTAIKFNGLTIKGYNNATGQLADTATNFGGGDFATGENAYKAFLGVINAMEARRYRGPFMVYVNSTQFHELLAVRTNTDTTQLALIRQIPQILDVVFVDSTHVADGTVLFVQMSPDVVQYYEALGVSNREWLAGNRTVFYGKVLTIAVPFIQYDVRGYTGIAKMTGA